MGDISKSYVNDLFAAGHEGVALFVGSNEGNISKSYATGAIKCDIVTCTGDIYGGFVGYMYAGTITQSYAVADLSDVPLSLGYGLARPNGGSATDSFWNEDVFANSEASLGDGATTTQMKSSTFYEAAGWDFTNDWQISPSRNSGYPELR